MKCPECNKKMVWKADNEFDESHYITEYHCEDCKIDVFKHWGEAVDSET